MSHKHHRNVRWTTRTVYFYSAQKQLRFAALWSSFAPPFSRGTDELIANFRSSNPGLTPLRNQRRQTSLRGQRAESLLMVGHSPLGRQNELIWLVTTERPNGLFYIAFVAPEGEYNQLRTQYQNMLRSVSFR